MESMEQHGEPAAYGVYVLPWRVGGSLVVKLDRLPDPEALREPRGLWKYPILATSSSV